MSASESPGFSHGEDVNSGLTMTGIHESDFSSWSYFTIADALVKFSARPDQDLKELFKRMLFNIAVFNNDDHLRNFGFLYAAKTDGTFLRFMTSFQLK